MDAVTRIPADWRQAAQLAAESPAQGGAGPLTVYVIGGADAGKSTLCRYLLDNLAPGFAAGYLDCDPGQSVIGPPATVGMRLFPRGWRPGASAGEGGGRGGETFLRFVGSTTPSGHLLQTLAGIRRLQDLAAEKRTERLIVDSSGFVQGHVAREFQYHLIDLLRPDLLLALGGGRYVEDALAGFRRSRARILRLHSSAAARAKTPEERRAYRQARFRRYFLEARETELFYQELGLHGEVPWPDSPGDSAGRLCALCDARQLVLALGIAAEVDTARRWIRLTAPPFAAAEVVTLLFGSVFLSPDGTQLPEPGGRR